MTDVNKALKEEYTAVLKDFVKKLRGIADVAKDDPLLRAQTFITIFKCDPAVSDFSDLKESLYKIEGADRNALIRDLIISLTYTIANTPSARKSLRLSVLLEELVDTQLNS